MKNKNGLFPIGVLANMQFVHGEMYETQALQYTATSVRITAARGEIVDRYGRPIAPNRMGYRVYFNRAEMPKGTENEKTRRGKPRSKHTVPLPSLAIRSP